MRFRSSVVRALVLGVGASLATSACGQYSISNIRALRAFQEAKAAYTKGDYRKAAAQYELTLQHNPDFAATGCTHFFIGNSYDQLFKPARKGQPENDANLTKAVQHYKLAIEKIRDTDLEADRCRRWAHEWLINAYSADKLNDLAAAEPVVRAMIALDPSDPSGYTTLAGVFEEGGRFEEAEEQFKKAIELKPTLAVGYSSLAGFYNRRGQFEKTMEAFRQRAELEPNNPEAWHTMATYYSEKVTRDSGLSRAKGLEYSDAGLAAEDKALAINPEYFEAVTFKNILLRAKAKYVTNPAQQKQLIEEADRLYKKAMDLQAKQGTAAAEAKKAGGGK